MPPFAFPVSVRVVPALVAPVLIASVLVGVSGEVGG